ncbi:MAG: hypothetical protein IKR72_01980 [Bacteroidales bacterium]|nr:hypothetical protein [Bacteroidales bacterium]
MAANLNLKTVFEADNKDLTRGANQAKQDLKDFGKVSNDVTSKIGDAFGINTQKLQQMSNATREMGRQMSESGNAGVAAFGKVLQSITAAQVAIAGLGLGAAISAFKLLTAEAENFKNTVAGANIELQTQAYISTYQQAMHDFNATTGQSVAKFEAKWKKGFSRLITDFKQSVVKGLTGNQSVGEALAGPVATALFGNKEQRQAADAAASANERRAGELLELSRQLKANTVEWAEMEAKIAEYRRIAKDDSYTLAQQQQAIADAEALVERRYTEEYDIRKKMADLQTAYAKEVGSSIPEEDKMYDMQKQAADVMHQKDTTLKSLNRDQRTLSAQAAAEAAERQKALAALEAQAKKMAELRAGVSGTDLSVSAASAAGIQGRAEAQMQIGAIIHPKYDPKEITDISKELASLVEMGVASVSESIGGLIGDLATGGEAWKNFSSAALSAFGDMAIAVGKMAIATGTATLGIKAALESLNGYVAIAAGAALVALGTAVKSGLSNIASGNYSAAASVAPSNYESYGSSKGQYATSTLKIELSGKLTASGRDLQYVLNEESNRKKTVT